MTSSSKPLEARIDELEAKAHAWTPEQMAQAAPSSPCRPTASRRCIAAW